MKKIIISLLISIFLISFLPSNSSSQHRVRVITKSRVEKWPRRHRYRRHVIIIRRYHRRHRLIWLPPPWLPMPLPIPNDPVR